MKTKGLLSKIFINKELRLAIAPADGCPNYDTAELALRSLCGKER
jgi:hypothetical protein